MWRCVAVYGGDRRQESRRHWLALIGANRRWSVPLTPPICPPAGFAPLSQSHRAERSSAAPACGREIRWPVRPVRPPRRARLRRRRDRSHSARANARSPDPSPTPTTTAGPCPQSRLSALFATRWILATLRCAGGRIGARGNRGIARAAIQSALELGDAFILAHDARFQASDLGVHPQKHLHDRLAPSVIDRFRLNPIHTTRFDAAELSPPTPTERLPRTRVFAGDSAMEPAGIEPATSCLQSRGGHAGANDYGGVGLG